MAGLTESWISEQSQAGIQLSGSGEDYAVGVQEQSEDDYLVIFDTKDGHPLRIPVQDRSYQLAKVRPTTPGDRAKWVKVKGRKGMVHYAEHGSTPAYSETPPVITQSTSPVAPQMPQEGKAGKGRRKRGNRGKRKASS